MVDIGILAYQNCRTPITLKERQVLERVGYVPVVLDQTHVLVMSLYMISKGFQIAEVCRFGLRTKLALTVSGGYHLAVVSHQGHAFMVLLQVLGQVFFVMDHFAIAELTQVELAVSHNFLKLCAILVDGHLVFIPRNCLSMLAHYEY